MKRVNFLIVHDLYSADTTMGKYYISEVDDSCSWDIEKDDNYFCETLEDAVRPEGIKIKHQTALPQNTECRMKVTHSPRFDRDMTIIYNQPNEYEVKHKGVSFVGARNHGGNTHVNTSGCPLVAVKRIKGQMRIYGTMEKEFTALVKAYIDQGFEIYWKSINKDFTDQ